MAFQRPNIADGDRLIKSRHLIATTVADPHALHVYAGNINISDEFVSILSTAIRPAQQRFADVFN